jgi:hypothetical protein
MSCGRCGALAAHYKQLTKAMTRAKAGKTAHRSSELTIELGSLSMLFDRMKGHMDGGAK